MFQDPGLNTEFLLSLSLNQLVENCALNRSTLEICQSEYFWRQKFDRSNLLFFDVQRTLGEYLQEYLISQKIKKRVSEQITALKTPIPNDTQLNIISNGFHRYQDFVPFYPDSNELKIFQQIAFFEKFSTVGSQPIQTFFGGSIQIEIGYRFTSSPNNEFYLLLMFTGVDNLTKYLIKILSESQVFNLLQILTYRQYDLQIAAKDPKVRQISNQNFSRFDSSNYTTQEKELSPTLHEDWQTTFSKADLLLLTPWNFPDQYQREYQICQGILSLTRRYVQNLTLLKFEGNFSYSPYLRPYYLSETIEFNGLIYRAEKVMINRISVQGIHNLSDLSVPEVNLEKIRRIALESWLSTLTFNLDEPGLRLTYMEIYYNPFTSKFLLRIRYPLDEDYKIETFYDVELSEKSTITLVYIWIYYGYPIYYNFWEDSVNYFYKPWGGDGQIPFEKLTFFGLPLQS